MSKDLYVFSVRYSDWNLDQFEKCQNEIYFKNEISILLFAKYSWSLWNPSALLQLINWVNFRTL